MPHRDNKPLRTGIQQQQQGEKYRDDQIVRWQFGTCGRLSVIQQPSKNPDRVRVPWCQLTHRQQRPATPTSLSRLQTRSKRRTKGRGRVGGGLANLFLVVLDEVRHQLVRPSKLPVHIHSNGLHEEVIRRVMRPFPRYPGTARAGWRCCGWTHLGHLMWPCVERRCVQSLDSDLFQPLRGVPVVSRRITVRGILYFIPLIFSNFQIFKIYVFSKIRTNYLIPGRYPPCLPWRAQRSFLKEEVYHRSGITGRYGVMVRRIHLVPLVQQYKSRV